jgi:ribosomal protein S19
MKEIKLSKGKATMVDDDMFEYLNQWKWYCSTNGYATRLISSVLNGDKRIYMARLIMGNPSGLMVDHIDCNPLNNQKNNLRICTNSQNQWNRKNTYGKSKYIGVSISVFSGKTYYRVNICGNKKKYYLGMYLDEEYAARVYDTKSKELHGEFATLNFKY